MQAQFHWIVPHSQSTLCHVYIGRMIISPQLHEKLKEWRLLIIPAKAGPRTLRRPEAAKAAAANPQFPPLPPGLPASSAPSVASPASELPIDARPLAPAASSAPSVASPASAVPIGARPSAPAAPAGSDSWWDSRWQSWGWGRWEGWDSDSRSWRERPPARKRQRRDGETCGTTHWVGIHLSGRAGVNSLVCYHQQRNQGVISGISYMRELIISKMNPRGPWVATALIFPRVLSQGGKQRIHKSNAEHHMGKAGRKQSSCVWFEESRGRL